MARIIIELTNRCNLRCHHCYDERHAAGGDLPLSVIDKVLAEGKDCGIDEISFTGGEPTVHRQFAEIVRRVYEADFDFGFVSNGMNFAKIHPLLVKYRRRFKGITLSLDGAEEKTHDRIRGRGSYRRVISAASQCLFNGISFTFNMVLTTWNYKEVAALVHLAEKLGCGGVRFGHLMFTPETAMRGMDLSPAQRRIVEAEIWRLKEEADVYVGMAPGYFNEAPWFPCAPLEREEYNLDYRGNLTLCCQLSGYTGPNGEKDTFGNLQDVNLNEAVDLFGQHVNQYRADKQKRVDSGQFADLDHFPCFYCVKYLGKTDWLDRDPNHSWARSQKQRKEIRIHVRHKHKIAAPS